MDKSYIKLEWFRVGADGGTPIEIHCRVGALHDHKGLYDRLTAREDIEYFGRLHGLAPATLSMRVAAVLRQLGVERIADRRTAGFSQGERMKVALGRRQRRDGALIAVFGRHWELA